MAANTPASAFDLLDVLAKSLIWPDDELRTRLAAIPDLPQDATRAAAQLVKHGVLTTFQARVLLTGKYRGFRLGAYVIREQIGQGGMGSVYLAQHETLRRPVAIKVLAPGSVGAQVKVNVERFLREARSAAALDHPNIVRIFDVAQLGETHYLVMEYVEGQNLEQIVAVGGPLSCGRAVEYVLQAAAGLEHASQKGFIHRDIKPANLILAKDGTLKILDMGLARSEESSDQVTEVFDKGAVVGTADFISPEQAMNAPDLDIRTDIYSLGATFYTLVTGKPPFRGNTTQKLMQHQIKDPPSLSALDKTFPPALATVVSKMMQKRPADRYQTPGEVMAALGPWLSNTSHVVSALSRSESRGSEKLRETLTEVVSGTSKRLPSVAATASHRGVRSVLPYAVAGVAVTAVGVLGLGAVVAYALSGRSDTTAVAAQQPRPPAAAAPLPAPLPAVPPTVAPAVPPVPADSRVLYRSTFEALEPFWEASTTVENEQRHKVAKVSDHTGTGTFPADWLLVSWNPKTVQESTAAVQKGVKAFGVRTASGEATTILLGPDIIFAGPRPRVRVEYAIDGSAGISHVRLLQKAPQFAEAREVAKLPATGGDWQTTDFDLDLRDATVGCLEFHTSGLPVGETVWLKSIVVYQPAN